MSAVRRRKLTPEQYLTLERAAAYKSEYYNGEMFAMAGASYEHTRVADNLSFAIRTALTGGSCYTLSHDMRVKVSPTGLYTYPDVIIVCGPPELEDNQGDTLLNPRVVIEVLSPTTESYDRGAKFRHYQRVESLQEYLLVAQDEPAIERFARRPDGSWTLFTVTGLDAEVRFESVAARVRLADVYAGVAFPPPPPPPPEPEPTGRPGRPLDTAAGPADTKSPEA